MTDTFKVFPQPPRIDRELGLELATWMLADDTGGRAELEIADMRYSVYGSGVVRVRLEIEALVTDQAFVDRFFRQRHVLGMPVSEEPAR